MQGPKSRPALGALSPPAHTQDTPVALQRSNTLPLAVLAETDNMNTPSTHQRKRQLKCSEKMDSSLRKTLNSIGQDPTRVSNFEASPFMDEMPTSAVCATPSPYLMRNNTEPADLDLLERADSFAKSKSM